MHKQIHDNFLDPVLSDHVRTWRNVYLLAELVLDADVALCRVLFQVDGHHGHKACNLPASRKYFWIICERCIAVTGDTEAVEFVTAHDLHHPLYTHVAPRLCA